jgi:hypothetical protein
LPCPGGTFSTVISASDNASCNACPAGTYSLPGSTSCTSCPIGRYSIVPGGSSFASCLECPKGYFSNKIGANSTDSCQPCPKGFYSDKTGSFVCTECPLGTYSDIFNASDVSMCKNCPAGTYSVVVGVPSVDNCTKCNPGTFSPFTRQLTPETCQLCPTGTYSIKYGANSSSDCLQCPPGTFNPALGQTKCLNCSVGTYSPELGSSSETTCVKCRVGTFQPIEGAGKIDLCLPCTPGTFSNELGLNNTCPKCPTGMFSIGLGNSKCTECSLGSYADTPGSSSCIQCPGGTFSKGKNPTDKSSNATCEKCVPGTFAVTDKNNEITCFDCPRGTYTDADGQLTCIKCPVGTYSNVIKAPSLSFCLPCPLGYFSNVLQATSCQICPAGTYADELKTLVCKNCTTGSYSGEIGKTNSSCVLCPIGTYSTTQKSTDSVSCIPCPENTKTTVPGSTNCTRCDGYCPIGSSLDIDASFRREYTLPLDPRIQADAQETQTFNAINQSLIWGVLFLEAILIAIIFVVILVVTRNINFLKYFDCVYNRKRTDVYDSTKDLYYVTYFLKKTNYGGCITILVVFIVSAVMLAITVSFSISNTIVTESLQTASNPITKQGTFNFSTTFVGQNASCDGYSINIDGNFQSGVNTAPYQRSCITNNLGCECYWVCTNCRPATVSIDLNFTIPSVSSLILYDLKVPHYLDDEVHEVKGSLLLTQTVKKEVAGTPSSLFFTIYPTFYETQPIAPGFTNTILRIPTTKREGYLANLITSSKGSVQASGSSLIFRLTYSSNTYIIKENIITKLLTFVGQVGSLSALLYRIGSISVDILNILLPKIYGLIYRVTGISVGGTGKKKQVIK